MSDLETHLFRAAYKYFAAHPSPPPKSDMDTSAAWWQTAAEDICKVSSDWDNHPLLMKLLIAVYEYLEEKAKEDGL